MLELPEVLTLSKQANDRFLPVGQCDNEYR